MTLVQNAAVEPQTLLEQPGLSEHPVESSNDVDTVAANAVEVAEESSAAAEQSLVVSSSTIEPTATQNPVSENLTFESPVAEQEVKVQGIAAIPGTQIDEHHHTHATTTSAEFQVEEVPVVETTEPEVAVEQAAALENSEVNNDAVDQS